MSTVHKNSCDSSLLIGLEDPLDDIKLSALNQGASRSVENKPNLFLLNDTLTVIMKMNRKLILLSLGHLRTVLVQQYIKTG